MHVSAARHTCRMCAHGCSNYDVMLTEQEALRLSLGVWRPLLPDVHDDMPLVVLDSATGQYMLNKQADGRCVRLERTKKATRYADYLIDCCQKYRASFAFDGLLKPLIFLTNWSEAARISSPVTGGSKLKRVLIFLHIGYISNVSKAIVETLSGAVAVWFE